jgi:hypothetical protein
MRLSLLFLALIMASPAFAHYKDDGKEIPAVEYVVGSKNFLDFKVLEFSPKANPYVSCVYIEGTERVTGGLSCYKMEKEH